MPIDLIYVILILMVLVVCTGAGWIWSSVKASRAHMAWPERWTLNVRPVFTADERALYRQLRSALPNHVVLAKVGLLRFCQSSDAKDALDWYKRLQHLHVALLVCTPQGTVVAAIDIEHPKASGVPQRPQRLKEAVMEACRIRYIRCLPGQWPQTSLLGAWVLGQQQDGLGRTSMPPVPQGFDPAKWSPSRPAPLNQDPWGQGARRSGPNATWGDSGYQQDSFFAFDSRMDSAANSDAAPLHPPATTAQARGH